ncbi:hypothetical protein IQ270_29465 [Microcoleus sp. LEGE 07076]|uniref:hypothetical protein n=1 Tax=Microcoleus sp. LEGE 07076 TaxID=915322 RepID=UPI00187E3137|nr:hypothetical protein [Microcoleus sp. LEGE 07076]MBE9188647.1 hypothetical protein [Microcoleus sp. LEGE 07076]
MRLVYCFCQGIGTKVAARNTGLSVKTVRGLYIALRERLRKPAFNRWHGLNRMLTSVSVPEHELIIRAEYFETLAACGLNETCRRNFRLGNRKARQCRACPLALVYSNERRTEAFMVIDAVHDFYERIGIRGEKDRPGPLLFRDRLIHTTVAGTVHAHSRKRANGFFDPEDRSFLSGGALLHLLVEDLANFPLSTGQPNKRLRMSDK